MSVCLSIIKVLPNVKYLGTDYEKLSKSERKNITELPDELFIEKFSDNQKHSGILNKDPRYFNTERNCS